VLRPKKPEDVLIYIGAKREPNWPKLRTEEHFLTGFDWQLMFTCWVQLNMACTKVIQTTTNISTNLSSKGKKHAYGSVMYLQVSDSEERDSSMIICNRLKPVLAWRCWYRGLENLNAHNVLFLINWTAPNGRASFLSLLFHRKSSFLFLQSGLDLVNAMIFNNSKKIDQNRTNRSLEFAVIHERR